MKIRGRVVFQDIEGGVWGIVDEKGRAYQPVDGLPAHLRKVGQRVDAEVEPAGLFSAAMWGRTVRIRSIKKA